MRRRRLILLTLACLTLGTATTVALAWAFAFTKPVPFDAYQTSTQCFRPTRGPVLNPNTIAEPRDCISAMVYASPTRILASTRAYGPEYVSFPGLRGFVRSSSIPPDELVPKYLRTFAFPWLHGAAWPRGQGMAYCEVQASGWPLIAMASMQALEEDFSHGRHFGLTLPWRSGGVTLPLRPLWPNFALDTLLFSLIWLPILLAPGALRRTLRRRRNQCPKCAYDLRATPVTFPCPECGHQR